jgi:hypothetical protein
MTVVASSHEHAAAVFHARWHGAQTPRRRPARCPRHQPRSRSGPACDWRVSDDATLLKRSWGLRSGVREVLMVWQTQPFKTARVDARSIRDARSMLPRSCSRQANLAGSAANRQIGASPNQFFTADSTPLQLLANAGCFEFASYVRHCGLGDSP